MGKRASTIFLFLLPLLLIYGEGIQIVYHIATMKNWESIVEEQLTLLQNSGLGEACDQLTVTVVGSEIKTVQKLIEKMPFKDKVRVIHASKDLRQYEFPAIKAALKIAQSFPRAKILYMHTKGVSHYRDPLEKNVRLWRHYLEYFVIEEWRRCVDALESFNLCGVEWLEEPELHFSGNFWWSRADYLRTCKGTLKRHGRWDCEYLIGSGIGPRVKSFHQSGKDLYHFAYHPKYYR